jgi:hypothetical protein
MSAELREAVGERDPDRLCEGALAALGGKAVSQK